MSIIVNITPSTPKGYATAYPSAICGISSILPASNNCLNASWAAPKPGVLVTAPDIMPVRDGIVTLGAKI